MSVSTFNSRALDAGTDWDSGSEGPCLELSGIPATCPLLNSAGSPSRPRLQPASPGAMLPQEEGVPRAAPADISLLVGPDFSLRCLHPGKFLQEVSNCMGVVRVWFAIC